TRDLRVGPAAAEEIRAAPRAERLRASSGWLEGLQQVSALDDPDRGRADASVQSGGAAGELLAALAVAVAKRLGSLGDLECHAAAEAASSESGHTGSLAVGLSSRRGHERQAHREGLQDRPGGSLLPGLRRR